MQSVHIGYPAWPCAIVTNLVCKISNLNFPMRWEGGQEDSYNHTVSGNCWLWRVSWGRDVELSQKALGTPSKKKCNICYIASDPHPPSQCNGKYNAFFLKTRPILGPFCKIFFAPQKGQNTWIFRSARTSSSSSETLTSTFWGGKSIQ